MILTGKAKEDFLIHIGLTEDMFLMMYSVMKNALIIDWFDLVGIYIDTQLVATFDECEITQVCWFVNIAASNNCYNSDKHYQTRQEATKQAILKANDIYNEIN